MECPRPQQQQQPQQLHTLHSLHTMRLAADSSAAFLRAGWGSTALWVASRSGVRTHTSTPPTSPPTRGRKRAHRTDSNLLTLAITLAL